jgi:hypothetical protein
MMLFFKVIFNLVLSISKTHLIVKLETFPHLRRARAGSAWCQGAVRPPPNSDMIPLLSSSARDEKPYVLDQDDVPPDCTH